MKKPALFGEREVARLASEILEDLRQEDLHFPHLRSGVFDTEEQGQIPFSFLVEQTAGFYGRTDAHNLWLELRLPQTSVKEMAARGTLEEIRKALSELSKVENSKTRIFSVLEDLDRLGR